MERLNQKLHRAATLSPHDWILVAESWVELARARAMLSLDAAKAVRGALDCRELPSGSERELPPQLLEMFLVAANHHVFRLTCLPKALALKRMLERRRLIPQLRIGARKEGPKLLGHAWIEIDGVPFNDSADVADRYPPLTLSEAGLAIWTAE
ncbi:MAG: lasso peptide biosynthesis B2 protein [Thermoanaerobaculia bacterium]|nr:lasso peptide biosynthesis B2 protein [Thermoanaerobaculia bacterium]